MIHYGTLWHPSDTHDTDTLLVIIRARVLEEVGRLGESSGVELGVHLAKHVTAWYAVFAVMTVRSVPNSSHTSYVQRCYQVLLLCTTMSTTYIVLWTLEYNSHHL